MTSWAKMSSDLDSNPKIRKAGREAREVFLFIVRRNAALDLGGRIPEDHIEPWYLADQLMMTEDEVRHGTSRAVTAGLVTIRDGHVTISGWNDEWAKRPLTEAERQQRRRDRIKSDGDKPNTDHELQENVTKRHEAIVTCPDNHGSEERRGEEKRDMSGKPDASALLARAAVAEINRLANRNYAADSKSVVKLCKALAKAKHTPENAVRVIASKREWLQDAKMRQYFAPGTLLALANFEKYLDELAAKAPKPKPAQSTPVVDDFEPMPVWFEKGAR